MIKAWKSLLAATVVLFLFGLAQSGVCPPCYRDQAILQGHGPVSATDLRRRVIIANDVPGANEGKVNTGIEGAAQKWNDARDTTSNPPNSYHTPYFFESGSYSQADFRVVSTGNSGPPAYIDLEHHPHEIRIRGDVLNTLSGADLAAMIAHELGHRRTWMATEFVHKMIVVSRIGIRATSVRVLVHGKSRIRASVKVIR